MDRYDIVIVGSGIAGLSAALKASSFARVALLTKSDLSDANTTYAQGGLAAALSNDDNTELHFHDTLRAGDGLCNEEAVRILAEHAPQEIQWLMQNKVRFDKQNGQLLLSREAVHSRPRIVHYKDCTGKEIEESLISQVKKNKSIDVFEDHFVIHLLTKNNRCYGAAVLDLKKNTVKHFISAYTILATGGAGLVYTHTTNPPVATGDGVALAYRAQAKIQDMEFFQFHPTALFNSHPTFLISETLRGEGGLLKNKFGKTYMEKYHRDGQLAPRDVVAKFSVIEMKKTKSKCVFLDISHKDSAYIKRRFPTIYKECLTYGIDITKQLIPVTPVAHYMIGGIKTDLNGHTSIGHLYAIGEVSCNGLHGADRLASNSLPEGLVFGTRTVESIKKQLHKNISITFPSQFDYTVNNNVHPDIQKLKATIQKIMWDNVGIIRTISGLKTALHQLQSIEKDSSKIVRSGINKEILELRNLVMTALLITKSALQRKESRGTHFLQDFPERNDNVWKRHTII